ncbi:hypothetical protein [Nesterenkonia jeotgali]|uniref:Uncharacterized protein n=1 Tax=Nesterenkonia jeotgali TaxID=317018 RepID=A0A839FFD9_9MICC|nr:hypothetical protein [Nesterenkonia jeotgali]MBA8920388.1 hypothetical protein [Nesterenkonia jeotgali]
MIQLFLADETGLEYRYATDKLKRELNMLFFGRTVVHEDVTGNLNIGGQLERPPGVVFSD